MKTFRVEFNFDQGNTIVHKVQAVDKESALSKIPSNGTYEISNMETGNIHRITINLVKHITVSEA
ncbi:hypothetical protein ACQKDD_13205 [Planococcus kocurii]|uniref:DUF2187 domain-containing protein n=1 Tax=Planococcus kocurii TaxID=1374 RepID=A0ABN4JXP5_9BACL|nr:MULTISPECIES: hypothetical protein [Planococcus]ALS78327.1 hypothetical protein AUO94_06495 [Planococcus kocurii]KAA0958264.1 hypothetical protein FQ085_00700 [Planococcus sp. ANT_H30]